jgi:hypothetical protein
MFFALDGNRDIQKLPWQQTIILKHVADSAPVTEFFTCRAKNKNLSALGLMMPEIMLSIGCAMRRT